VQKSAGKVLPSIFWNQDGILLVDYLPKGQTVSTEYYSSLVVWSLQLVSFLVGLRTYQHPGYNVQTFLSYVFRYKENK
jgi:hypothetical protein